MAEEREKRRCHNCAAWHVIKETEDAERPEQWGNCAAAGSAGGRPDRDGTRHVAQDSHRAAAYLHTHSTFCCISHRPEGEDHGD